MHAGLEVLHSALVKRAPSFPLPASADAIPRALASAPRIAGRAAVLLTPAEQETLTQSGIHWPLPSMDCAGVARLCVLVHAGACFPPDTFHSIWREAWRFGDNEERVALLRALAFVDDGNLLQDAVDACRSSVQDIFEAIACNNPYPARHFPDLHFNQMVLKALFTGASVERVVDWRSRASDDLRRMVGDFASERRAAGRAVPPDVQRILNHGAAA